MLQLELSKLLNLLKSHVSYLHNGIMAGASQTGIVRQCRFIDDYFSVS